MNKVYIRARQIDSHKQLPILIRGDDDLSDFNEYSNTSKSSQYMSGMDKGEESEHHLQKILQELQYEKTAGNTAIPIPEIHDEFEYRTIYQTDFICPKNYIRLKTLEFEDEYPEYDLDEEDQEWLENSKLDVTVVKFEKIIEEFERACSQKALLLDEAKGLLRNEPEHIVIAVYDYWLTKRVRTEQPLVITVKAEKAERGNNTPIDPYIAFRKRSEKMMTRKNRRVDESAYEAMYRFRSHIDKLSATIELVAEREATKCLISQTERAIFINRCQSRDYGKLHLNESDLSLRNRSIKLADSFKAAQRSREENHREDGHRKRSHSKSIETSESSNEPSPDGLDFTFRPMVKCKYLPSKFPTTAFEYRSLSKQHIVQQSWYSSSRLVGHLLSRLHTLYIRDTNCGLPALDAPSLVDESPITAHISSLSLSPGAHHPMVASITSHHNTDTTTTITIKDQSHHNSPLPPQSAHQAQQAQSHHTRSSVSQPPIDNLCTYQTTTQTQTQPSDPSNKNHTLTGPDRWRNQQKLSPTTIKEQCNHSLNGVYPSRLSQVVDVNCLKSLTNKRLISCDNIDDIANFYSKSNGQFNNYPSNQNNLHIHHHNHHNYRLHHLTKKKSWLTQNTADNCLRPSLLPLWQQEAANVMTSVNKMT